MNLHDFAGAVEAIIFASGEPIALSRIAEAIDCSVDLTNQIVDLLCRKYNRDDSGVRVLKLDQHVQMCVNRRYLEDVRAALALTRNAPLSQAALEVLAVIAYNQPVTKAFVEQVRGVDCSGVIGGLTQKSLIEEKGRLELPGRPLIYGTTDHFLRCMGMSSLTELPTPDEIRLQMGSNEPVLR